MNLSCSFKKWKKCSKNILICFQYKSTCFNSFLLRYLKTRQKKADKNQENAYVTEGNLYWEQSEIISHYIHLPDAFVQNGLHFSPLYIRSNYEFSVLLKDTSICGARHQTTNPTINGWPSLPTDLQLDDHFFRNRRLLGHNTDQKWLVDIKKKLRFKWESCCAKWVIIYLTTFHYHFYVNTFLL